jgi:hypothetical protein
MDRDRRNGNYKHFNEAVFGRRPLGRLSIREKRNNIKLYLKEF